MGLKEHRSKGRKMDIWRLLAYGVTYSAVHTLLVGRKTDLKPEEKQRIVELLKKPVWIFQS